jgi:AmiR/NasT family two-component response regulator
MPRALQIRDEPSPPLGVMLIDSNAVFRAACRALLLTEGVDVVADLAPGCEAIELVHRLRPDVVLVEATDRAPRGPEIAALICSLPDAPSVLLISADDRPELAAAIGARGHLARADIRAEAIVSAAATPSSPTTQSIVGPAEPSD